MIAKYINKVSFTFLVFHVSTTLDRWLIKYERIMKFRDKKKKRFTLTWAFPEACGYVIVLFL